MKHLFEERNHIEGLLNTRFNFFLAIFAAIVAAIIAVKTPNQLKFILMLGALIESLLSMVIGRAQLKLTIYLKKIRKTPNEAEYFGNRVANSKNKNPFINGSRNSIIGKYLPMIVSIGLIISLFFSSQIFAYLNNNVNQESNNKITIIDNKIISIENELKDSNKKIQLLTDSLNTIKKDLNNKKCTMHNTRYKKLPVQ